MSKALTNKFSAIVLTLVALFITASVPASAAGGSSVLQPAGGGGSQPGGAPPAGGSDPQPGGIANPLGSDTNTVTDLITNATQWMLGMVGVLAVAALIWGGIMYITAFVDEGQTQKAKKIITWAIIGLIVAGGAYAILALVNTKILKIT